MMRENTHDQHVLLRVFIRQECLPAAVRRVVAPNQLDVGGPDLVLDLVDALERCVSKRER